MQGNILAGGGKEEDMISIAYLGLCKAAASYDKDTRVKFATYAYRVIKNEILMEIRRRTKKRDNEFLYQDLYERDKEFCLEDIVPEGRSCFESIEEEWIYSVIEGSSYLDEREKKIVFRLVLQGRKQKEIAGELGITQAQISRLQNKALEKLRIDYLMNYA